MKEDAAFVKIAVIVNVDNVQKFLERKNIVSKYRCSYFPCHKLDYDNYDCRSCYCPLYDICSKKAKAGEKILFGGYLLDNNILACEKCSFIHKKEIVEFIYDQLDKSVSIENIYSKLKNKYMEENNMNRVRGFEVCKDYIDKDITLPIRKTAHSVAYDLETAEDITIPSIWKTVFKNLGKFLTGNNEFDPIKPTMIKTGVKAYFGHDEALFLVNRSSNPGKRGLILANSIGVIESDYYNNPDNDGNLIYAYYNIFPTDLHLKKHDVIGQAYFQKFLIIDDDHATGQRLGGFGSTDKK